MSGARQQGGFSLIEVLISVLILAIGLLGAAAIQLNALKFTDSSTLLSQASFVAYDMMDRIRANPDAGGDTYVLANLNDAPVGNGLVKARDVDWRDFAASIRAFAGNINGNGSSIAVNGRVVTITVQWCDQRALNTDNCINAMQSFVLKSRVAIDKGIQ